MTSDHLIAFSSGMYFKDRNIKVLDVTANESIEAHGKPIVSQGGGNIGDLFYWHEEFRRNLIVSNPNSPIVIMPQSAYFISPEEARRSKEIYNSHGNLTIFVRELESYNVARRIFDKCKIVLCPDIAWYLCEFVEDIIDEMLEEDSCIVRGNELGYLQDGYQVKSQVYERIGCYHPKFQISMAVVLEYILKLSRCKNLRTERLHAHILACMMGIENCLLPIKYHKNSSSYETWTRHLKGVYDSRQIS